MDSKKRLILASASPRRKELLEQIGIKCVIFPANISEETDPILSVERQIETLALSKILEVAFNFPNHIILGADTVVVLDNEILGKPKDSAEARKMLEKLNGKEHTVLTGVAVLDSTTKKKVIGHEKTYVRMRNNSNSIIDRYVKSAEPMDKAGAYAIQGYGALLVKEIRGEFSNVVGLPLGLTASLLGEVDFEV